MFIRNSWYVAAWSDELSEKPVERLILEEPVMLFRAQSGVAVALENRCAHRHMPLAHGRILERTIVCCYHGITYDFGGRCVRVPGTESVPANLKVRSYPVAERYGAVWVWTGNPELADETKIFKCDLLDPEGGNGHKFYFHVKSNYLYINDNLSDLLHQAYLHNPSFGGNTEPLGETQPVTSEDGERIYVKWDWPNMRPPATHARVGGIRGLGDGWNYSTYQPPSFYINSRGWADAGTGGIDSARPQGLGKHSFTIYQLITPETATTTHFFKIVACDWPAQMIPELRRLIDAVNREDIWACEEQQRMEALDSAAPMTPVATDAPVTKMRRVLQRLHALEQEAAPV